MSDTNEQAPEEIFLDAENEAVIKHMEMYQGIITRMAGNSAACKTWGVPFVAVIFGLVVEGKNINLVFLAILTALVFFYLDCYYLMLENRFRDGFNDSAKKIQMGKFPQSSLYVMLPLGTEKEHWKKAFKSNSTWPLYGGLIVLLILGYLVMVSSK